MPFPLFDLPAEAVELVLGSVDDLEAKRALRLVCKRSRASVDSRVVAVKDGSCLTEPGGGQQLVSALVQAPWQLQVLHLTEAKLGDAGAAALAVARWPGLLDLDLRGNSISDAGAASLAAAHRPALEMAFLGYNSMGDAGAAFVAAARWPALCVLNLARTGMGPAGAVSLASAHWPALEMLFLGYNNLGDAGAASLATARWPALRLLNLGHTGMGPAGAASLAAVSQWPLLEELHLHQNSLGDAGTAALTAGDWPALKFLSLLLDTDDISDEGSAAVPPIPSQDPLGHTCEVGVI